MSLYDIECYDETIFKTKYKNLYIKICDIATKNNIDLNQYYFGQYTKYGKSEEISYNHNINEDSMFDVQYYDGKLDEVILC